ncbi:hypothetical protein RCH27_20730 [Paracidovorax citrulli]|uniref:hypothetical protein n=1 Tax=Paracidovorax citrulli TaxID=80869 RepID=UPI003A7FD9AA
MSTSVKVFDSGQTGAPVLSGTAGALRAVLKACLVDGFGAGATASVTVAAGVATAIYSSGHPFRVGSVALFAGATGAGINGERRILTIASDRVTFAAPDAADGAAAGSITSRMAPAGWQELFAGQLTNVTALKPAVPEATGCVLRLDDTGTTTARVVGYEAMSDISTGWGPFPTNAQISGGLYWAKSNVASTAPRAWRCVTGDRWFLIWVAPVDGAPHGCAFAWGDVLSYRSGDTYACAILGSASDVVVNTGAPIGGCLGYGHAAREANNGLYLARAATALGGSIRCKKVAAHNLEQGYSGTSTYNPNGYAYPSPVDFGLRIAPVEVAAGPALRGRLAGVYHCAQVLGDAFLTGDTIPGEGAFTGRTLLALRCGAPGADLSLAGTVFVDVTGPWE